MLGGALLDLGVYAVRYRYELFGIPETIQFDDDMHEVDYAEKINFQYPGFEANMHISMKEDACNFFEIKGTRGPIYVPKFNSSKREKLETNGEEEEEEKIPDKNTTEVMALLDECRRRMGLVYLQEKAGDTDGNRE